MDQPLENKSHNLVQSLETQTSPDSKRSIKPILIVILIIVLGIVTGWGITYATKGSVVIGKSDLKTSEEVATSGVKIGDVVGVQDEKTFKDSAEGVLAEGGSEGEGSHHLLRPGGESQNVYLTSSTVDLSLFNGHKVQVWGETFSAQHAGWLMDVGRLKVIELNAAPVTTNEVTQD